MPSTLYQLRQVSRTFRRGTASVGALREVSFSIDRGEFVAVGGPSGSGKSTLLHIMGLLDPDFEGELLLDGRSTRALAASARAGLRLAHIGLVYQGFHLLPILSVRDNVALPHWRLQGDRRAARQRAEGLLERCGLSHRASHRANELSTGEMQRVAVARALVNDPAVVLADEPTGNLDARSKTAVLELLGAVNAQGRTVVVISHDPEVQRAGRRALILRHGHLDPSDRHPCSPNDEPGG